MQYSRVNQPEARPNSPEAGKRGGGGNVAIDPCPKSNAETQGQSGSRVGTRAPVILCIHPNVELYGSDRSFVQVVSALKQGWPEARVKVLLSGDGPLNAVVATVADAVVVRSQCVLRKAEGLKTLAKATVAFPYYFLRAWRDIASADLVYINTVVDPAHLLAARTAPAKTVIHVHEIPVGKAMPLFRSLCRAAGSNLIFNSRATADAFAIPASQRQAVIHNGVDGVPDAVPSALPESFTPARPLRIAMLGRINDWKGQDLLIEALGRLDADERRRISVRIVGGTFRDVPEPIDALKTQIAAADLETVVTIEPFQDDPASIYRWSDVTVVPSKKPEPFGMVAIEAMAHARPVIAAAHGGLTEIVEHGESGWLFTPNDAAALAAAVRECLADPAIIAGRGLAALTRFRREFDRTIMLQRTQETVRGWLGGSIADRFSPPHR